MRIAVVIHSVIMRDFLLPAVFLAVCLAARAHEPAKARPEGPAGLVIETSAHNPWSHLEMRNDPQAFQFAIVSDRTGGARPGVFEEAIQKLNLLQPEFVMSVGDLIEGYSKDRAEIDSQWNEFQGFIKKLEMPFFYVPGNHDYSNPEMAKAWQERFGRDYYSFVYRDVLFVCLNSQEPEMHHIGDKQAQWLEETLAAHPDVRWTLVFLHSPLWEETYPKDRGWQRIEKALGSRKYTVFSGHFHSYLKQFRGDHRYYTLATTGGGSGLRGPAHGEFDHVVWVTMTEGGPLVTNLMLQGIWGDDVRTPEIRDLVRTAESGIMVSVTPAVLPPGKPPETVRMDVVLTNPLPTPVELTFALVASDGVAVQLGGQLPKTNDGRYRVILQPQSQRSLDLKATPGSTYRGEALVVATIASEAKFLTAEKLPVTLRSTVPVPIFPLLELKKAGNPVKVDGDLAEWKAADMVSVDKPSYPQGKVDSWKGQDDSSFRWAATTDDQFLYLAVDVVDEDVEGTRDVPPWKQDGVELRIDPRPAAVRATSPDADARDNGVLLMMSPSSTGEKGWTWQESKLPEGVQAICVRSKTGYKIEAAVPLEALNKINPGWRKDGLRLNVAVDDHDDGEGVQIWWQADWRTPANVPGSGVFFPSQD